MFLGQEPEVKPMPMESLYAREASIAAPDSTQEAEQKAEAQLSPLGPWWQGPVMWIGLGIGTIIIVNAMSRKRRG